MPLLCTSLTLYPSTGILSQKEMQASLAIIQRTDQRLEANEW